MACGACGQVLDSIFVPVAMRRPRHRAGWVSGPSSLAWVTWLSPTGVDSGQGWWGSGGVHVGVQTHVDGDLGLGLTGGHQNPGWDVAVTVAGVDADDQGMAT